MSGPILPRNLEDPTGTDRRERAAIRDFNARLAKVEALYLDALSGLTYQKVTVNAEAYRYNLDPQVLAVMLAEIGLQVDRILLEGGEDRLWYSVDYVIPSYQQGTASAWANLGAQSAAYVASRPTLEALLTSDAYRRRISYLRAREFELMKGFTADTKKDMALILSDGLATGLGPRTIAGQLTEQMGIEERRAERIARTEVPNALRQARMDEAQASGLTLRVMHISALSPTTRETHRARHAKLYGVQDAREWWAKDANSINCKCSPVEVLTDEDGNPLDAGVVERAQRKLKA